MDRATSGLLIDFDDRGSTGRVTVTCEPDDDPARWGYPLLGLAMPLDDVRGFPVLHGRVESDAEGYASFLGWVQVVRSRDHEAAADQESVDVAPQLASLDVPYLAFGPRPALFDAPSTDQRGDVDWVAHTYLVATPDCVLTRQLAPLCGFRWGYRVRERRPLSIAPLVIGAADWSTDRLVLQRHHPSWAFGTWAG